MYQMLKALSDPIGLLGVVLQLAVYFLLSTNRLGSNTLLYQLCNMLGACCILYSLCFHWNTPSVLIEVAWFLISLRAVWRLVR